MIDMQVKHQFSPLDETMPQVYISFIYCFQCNTRRKERIYSILQDGLAQMARRHSFVTGRITEEGSSPSRQGQRPGSLTMHIPEPFEAPELIYNDLTSPESGWQHTYEDLKRERMPGSKLDGDRLVAVPFGQLSQSNKCYEFQANFIPGGCMLVGTSCHKFVDAWGHTVIMDAWAQGCREVQGLAGPETPASDGAYDGKSTALEQEMSADVYEALKSRSELWRLLALNGSEDGHSAWSYSFREVDTCIFRFLPGAVKSILQDASGGKIDGRLGVNDALTAFIWRSVMRARYPPGSEHKETSRVLVPIDGRARLSPAVPIGHVGNVVFASVTELPLSKLTAHGTTLSTIANAVRQSEEDNLSPDLLRDAVKLAATIPDARNLVPHFETFFDESLIISAIFSMPIYDMDFGSIFGNKGRAEFFRAPAGQFKDIVSLLPARTDNELEIRLSLSKEQMVRLKADADFSKHTAFVCS